jgi:hypothetical protein
VITIGDRPVIEQVQYVVAAFDQMRADIARLPSPEFPPWNEIDHTHAGGLHRLPVDGIALGHDLAVHAPAGEPYQRFCLRADAVERIGV